VGWQYQQSDDFESRFRRMDKKHPHECTAAMRNMAKYFDALQEGVHPLQIKAGFIHNEPKGIKAIDQSGCDIPAPTQLRLYTYPETDKGLLHVITIGTKTDQSSDIRTAEKYVDQLRKQ
jgi:hypothetical protein